jgi:hypothetical protein
MKKLFLVLILFSSLAFATGPITKNSGSFTTNGNSSPIVIFTPGESALFRVTVYEEDQTQMVCCMGVTSAQISYTGGIGAQIMECDPTAPGPTNILWVAQCSMTVYAVVDEPITLSVVILEEGFTDEYTTYWDIEKIN